MENEASGVAITRKGKALFGDQIRHAGDVFDLAKQGNPQAQAVVDDMAYDLAVMFSVLIAHVADPWMFVIGGGMMPVQGMYCLDKVVANFKNLVDIPMRDALFEVAKLEEPGIIGAAMLPISHGNSTSSKEGITLVSEKCLRQYAEFGSSAGRQCSERADAGN